MEFKENNAITIPRFKDIFIYFLIYENEVVYVGQTHNGLSRPLSHKDKLFDTIKIIYCEQEQLDILENQFIMKYKPFYNKRHNYNQRYSLYKARGIIREKYNIKKFFVNDIKKIMKKLGIVAEELNNTKTISLNEFEKICEVVENGYSK